MKKNDKPSDLADSAPTEDGIETAAVGDEASTAADGDEASTAAVGDEASTAAVGDEASTAAVGDEASTAAVGDETSTAAVGDEASTAAVGDETSTAAVGDEASTAAVSDETAADAVAGEPADAETPEESGVDAVETSETSGEGEKDPKRDKKEKKKKKSPPKKKTLVGAIFAVIPTILCVVIIIVAANMNELSFYKPDMELFDHNVLLICFGLLVVSGLLAAFRPRIPKAIGWIVWALIPAGAMLLAEWIIRNPFDEEIIKVPVLFLNMAIYYITAGFFLFLTRNTFVSVMCSTVFPLVLAVANHYVKLFRGTVLFPWDFQSIGIAMSVADNYEFDFPLTLALVVESFVVIWQLAYFSRVKIFRSFKKAIISFVCAALCLGMGAQYAHYLMDGERAVDDYKLYPYLFTPNAVYNHDGMMVSLIYSLQFINVEKPDGYSKDAVIKLTEKYAEKGEAKNGGENAKKPNIIAIMNEAWADISVIAPFTTSKEVFPVTSQLKENTVRGSMYMSIVGGNTANSEFEFLTGSTMAFMPPGSVAYQQFVKHETPTLVSSLESQGYQSAAIHPYNAGGWDRNKVYPMFGFDNSYFKNDFPQYPEYIRGYISDRTMYGMIENIYERRDKSRPFFLFGVTMQNHGGYTGHYENFPQDVFVEGLEANSQLSQYLSLIRESDFAFGEFIDYFKKVKEPTMIIMFGDHQPNESVTAPLYGNAGLKYPPKGDDEYNKYIVPVIIWANYDIEERDDVVTSANYLSGLVCDIAGLKTTPYQDYLRSLREKYPVVTANFFIDEDGAFHTNDEMKSVDDFNDYRIFQYNQIIDSNNTVNEAFSPVK